MSPFADPGLGATEHYPAWSADRQIPMSTEEIEDIFLDLTQKFGFQRDSMRNLVRGQLVTTPVIRLTLCSSISPCTSSTPEPLE